VNCFRQITKACRFIDMKGTVEDRVTDLENEVRALKASLLAGKQPVKDWRRTVGMLPDDEISHEADRLGMHWRREQRDI
jgi:hypothetical protein